jgi:hypothetical protein
VVVVSIRMSSVGMPGRGVGLGKAVGGGAPPVCKEVLCDAVVAGGGQQSGL